MTWEALTFVALVLIAFELVYPLYKAWVIPSGHYFYMDKNKMMRQHLASRAIKDEEHLLYIKSQQALRQKIAERKDKK